jgi:hypothetical protein
MNGRMTLGGEVIWLLALAWLAACPSSRSQGDAGDGSLADGGTEACGVPLVWCSFDGGDETTPSSGTCDNIQSDPHNCGACGNACSAGQDCVKAMCQPPQSSCLDGGFLCQDYWIPDGAVVQHVCSTATPSVTDCCGRVCSCAGYSCSQGQCGFSNPPPACDGGVRGAQPVYPSDGNFVCQIGWKCP